MRKFWVALSSIEEIDSSFIQRLYNYFGDIEKAFNATDLSAIDGLSVKKAENFLRLRDKVDVDKVYQAVVDRGVNFLTFEDEKYREILIIRHLFFIIRAICLIAIWIKHWQLWAQEGRRVMLKRH